MTVVAESRVTDTDDILPIESWASTPAPHEDVLSAEQWLETLPTEALQCRAGGHHWERDAHYEITGQRGRKITELTREVCCLGGCGAVKKEVLVPDGYGGLVPGRATQYRYTKPYARKRDGTVALDPVDRAGFRGELIHRKYPELHF